MQYYDYNRFLRLSAVLNYQLSAAHIDWNNIMTIILGGKYLVRYESSVLMQVMDYLNIIYGEKKRRLGPLSVLHPLRATTILSRTVEKQNMLDLMTELLHDHFEDNKTQESIITKWFKIDTQFEKFLKKLPEKDQNSLMQRLDLLTRRSEETYYKYIGRLLDSSIKTPEVVRVKLADRLDNTLDMRIEFEDPLQEINFYEHLFKILFKISNNNNKHKISHPRPSVITGTERLFQLFKNVVLMSLIRQKKAGSSDSTVDFLFKNLALASIKEAQQIVLHIFMYHDFKSENARQLILETMEYVQKGGINIITSPTNGHRLDGLFISRFDNANKKMRNQKLEELYKDKSSMVEAAMAFIVMFHNFLNNPDFFIKGISDKGVKPDSF